MPALPGVAGPSAPAASAPIEWNLPARAAFRFAFVLLVLLCAPSPLEQLPLGDAAAGVYLRGKALAGGWIATHVMHWAVSRGSASAGAGAVGWLLVGSEIVVAAAAAVVWSALDRRRRSHARLHEGLRIYLRATLAAVMLVYGFAKIFCVQFPPPSGVTLDRMLGELSPSELLWAFMGVSRGYQLFGGVAEVVGALLLVFRRTTTLGALVLAGVLANVVALNFFYDVPVKLWSTTLLAVAVFLALPDAVRLGRALVTTRAIPAAREPLLFASRRGVRVARTGAAFFALVFLVPTAWKELEKSRARPLGAAGPLAGFYVDDAPCGSAGAPRRWVGLDLTGGTVHVLRADRSAARYQFPRYDAAAKTLTLVDRAHGTTYALTADLEGDSLHLAGEVEGEPVDARLVRREGLSSFALVTHPMHW